MFAAFQSFLDKPNEGHVYSGSEEDENEMQQDVQAIDDRDSLAAPQSRLLTQRSGRQSIQSYKQNVDGPDENQKRIRDQQLQQDDEEQKNDFDVDVDDIYDNNQGFDNNIAPQGPQELKIIQSHKQSLFGSSKDTRGFDDQYLRQDPQQENEDMLMDANVQNMLPGELTVLLSQAEPDMSVQLDQQDKQSPLRHAALTTNHASIDLSQQNSGANSNRPLHNFNSMKKRSPNRSVTPQVNHRNLSNNPTPPQRIAVTMSGGYDFEAQLMNGVVFNDGEKSALEENMQDQHQNMHQNDTNSIEIDSFKRLYYDGAQRKRSRQQAIEDQEATMYELEASQMQNLPTISKISDAVAKSMPHRPKKAEQFQKYSTEWSKLRDAKIEAKREQLLNQERSISQSKSFNNESKKYLPTGYKGPMTGYYQQVNRYFEKKNENMEKNIEKTKKFGIPTTNRRTGGELEDPNETVEQRLIRKGKEYNSKKVQKVHQQLNEETVFGPQYQPKLISNNQQYLPNGQGQVRHAKVQNENVTGAPLPQNLSAHEMLYYDAMVGMVQKQQKIVKAKESEQSTRQPMINEKSRQMAQGRTITDLFTVKKNSVDQGYSNRSKSPTPLDQDKYKNAQTVNSFIQRNYHKENKKKVEKERKEKAQQDEADKLAKENATPQISTGSRRMNDGKTRVQPTFEQLYSAAKKLSAGRDKLIEKHERMKKEKEDAEFTYQPKLTHNQQDKHKAMVDSMIKAPKSNNYQPASQQQKNTSYSQRHQQKQMYRCGQAPNPNQANYQSDGQLNMESRSLMMMIPNNYGTMGQGLTHSSQVSNKDLQTSQQLNKRQSWSNRGGMEQFNNEERRVICTTQSPDTTSQLDQHQQQQYQNLVEGGVQDDQNFKVLANGDVNVFDDETNEILQSYPKTVKTFGRDADAGTTDQMHRTMDSKQMSLTQTQQMGRLAQQLILNADGASSIGIDPTNQNLSEEENMLQGFFADMNMTQSQQYEFTGGDKSNNLQSIIQEAKLAMQEYDQEQLHALERNNTENNEKTYSDNDDHRDQTDPQFFHKTMPLNPQAPVHSTEFNKLAQQKDMAYQQFVATEEQKASLIGLVTPPTKQIHKKSPSVNQINQANENGPEKQSSQSRANMNKIGGAHHHQLQNQVTNGSQISGDSQKLYLLTDQTSSIHQTTLITDDTPNVKIIPSIGQSGKVQQIVSMTMPDGGGPIETFGSDQQNHTSTMLRNSLYTGDQQQVEDQQSNETFKGPAGEAMTPEGALRSQDVRQFSADRLSNSSALRSGMDDISAARKYQVEMTPDIAFNQNNHESDALVDHQSPFNLNKDSKQATNQVIDQQSPYQRVEINHTSPSSITPEQQNRFLQMIDEAAREQTHETYQSSQQSSNGGGRIMVNTPYIGEVDQSAYEDQQNLGGNAFNGGGEVIDPHSRQPMIQEEENVYGEQTPQPLHYRMIDKTLSQIDEDVEEDAYSHMLMSQQTPVTPIQFIDQSADDISPVQYKIHASGGGAARTRSDHIHYNLTQQLTGSYQKTRNAAAATQNNSNNIAASVYNQKLPTQNSSETQ